MSLPSHCRLGLPGLAIVSLAASEPARFKSPGGHWEVVCEGVGHKIYSEAERPGPGACLARDWRTLAPSPP